MIWLIKDDAFNLIIKKRYLPCSTDRLKGLIANVPVILDI